MRLRLCIALAAIATLAVPATADGYIFWSSYDSGKSRVGRAGLDGSGVNPELVGDIYFGAAVATDGTYVYWGETGSSPKLAQIGRATVDGGEINHAFQTGATYCGIFGMRAPGLGPLLAEERLLERKPSTEGSTARRTPATPATPSPAPAATSAASPSTPTTSTGAKASTSRRRPTRCRRSLPTKPGSTSAPAHAACGVAVDGGHVYWTTIAPADPETFRADAIGRASIDGSEASVENDFIVNASFFTSVSTPSGIDVDGAFIYWTQPACRRGR